MQNVKSEPILYDEAMSRIRGDKKEDKEMLPETLGTRMVTTSQFATGYDRPETTKGIQPDPSNNNVRVKLPDKDDDDLSDVDNENEKELEQNERMKIKLEA